MKGIGVNPISDWQFDELVRPAEVPRSGLALQIRVPFTLTERGVYLYLEVKQSPSAASYILSTELQATFQDHLVGRFPAQIGDITALTTNQSIGSLLNGGGSPVGDSFVLRLNNPFDTSASGIQTAVLQPLRFTAEIDGLRLLLHGASGANVIGWRAFLACKSLRA